MQIGPHQLPNNLFLAPMAGVTDAPFRRLCQKYGAGLATSEMIAADTSLWASRKTKNRLRHDQANGLRSVQIVGAEPAKLAQAAKINADLGADIIDINMGCPAKKVCKRAAGSALLQDETLVGQILHAVVEAVEIPVTLKIRTGWDQQNRNALRIAQIAESAGIQALAIHGRTRACRFTGQAEYATIQQVKAATRLPIIANGDIDSPEKARQILDFTGSDGLMIGRAAQGRPWLFREINYFLRNDKHLAQPSTNGIKNTLLEHLEGLYKHYGTAHGTRIARKHIGWYLKSQPASAQFRHEINRVDCAVKQMQLIDIFFATLTEQEELAA